MAVQVWKVNKTGGF